MRSQHHHNAPDGNSNGWRCPLPPEACNGRHRARSLVGSVFSKLKDEDREALWKDIYVATRDLAPSGIMFADGVRASGLKLMQEHNVAEGVDLTIAFMRENRWGEKGRIMSALDVLQGYGPAAKKALPHLLEMQKNNKFTPEELTKLEAAIAAIENGEPRELKSIANLMK